MIKGTCQAWKMRDAVESVRVRRVIEAVASVLNDALKNNKADGSLIIEDMGDWYYLGAWANEGGYFVTLRIAPLDLSRPEAFQAAGEFMNSFVEHFQTEHGAFERFGDEGSAHSLLKGEPVTLVMITQSTPISD